MARIVHWPNGLKANYREPLSGPRSVGGAATTTVGNFLQTVSSPFGLWRWRFMFPPMRRQLFRRYRGWVTSLHGGANATRVPFCDWDGLSLAQRGITTERREWLGGQPWGNGQMWSNGTPWKGAPPYVTVSVGAARDETVIGLGGEFWGRSLDIGDFIGFYPLHLGLYMVTEVVGDGVYRIWPPLRKAVTLDDFATLEPTLAMRLESEEAAAAPRGAAFSENASVTLVEVLDYDVRDYFSDFAWPVALPWILADGRWNDGGVWKDGEVYP